MNNETHEDRVKILEGAPDGCVGLSFYNDRYCIYDEGVWLVWGNVWFACLGMNKDKSPKNGIRSLADIQKLVDMQNEIDEVKETTVNDFTKAPFGEFCNPDNGVDFSICDAGRDDIQSFLERYNKGIK